MDDELIMMLSSASPSEPTAAAPGVSAAAADAAPATVARDIAETAFRHLEPVFEILDSISIMLGLSFDGRRGVRGAGREGGRERATLYPRIFCHTVFLFRRKVSFQYCTYSTLGFVFSYVRPFITQN